MTLSGIVAVSVVAVVVGTSLVLVLGFLITRGRITPKFGFGRTLHELGPIHRRIAAPREVVFDVVSSPYLGNMPAAMREKLQILERREDVVVAAHRTHLPWMDATTVESVHFERPRRIRFSLLRGPVASVEEDFLLERGGANGEGDEETLFTYTGSMGADLWSLGGWYARTMVVPRWEAVVLASVEEIAVMAEGKAAARARRARRSRP